MEAIHAQLKEQAQRNRRSVTKEAVTLIETALAAGPRTAPALSPPIKLKGGPLTTAEIEAWIAEGRD